MLFTSDEDLVRLQQQSKKFPKGMELPVAEQLRLQVDDARELREHRRWRVRDAALRVACGFRDRLRDRPLDRAEDRRVTGAQKIIALAALVAIAATLLFAPHHYTAHNEISTIFARNETAAGTFYAPAWSSAVPSETFAWNPNYRADSVQLDTGMLGMWWVGIVIVAAVAIVVASPRSNRSS